MSVDGSSKFRAYELFVSWRALAPWWLFDTEGARQQAVSGIICSNSLGFFKHGIIYRDVVFQLIKFQRDAERLESKAHLERYF